MVAKKQLPIDQERLRNAQLGKDMMDAAVREQRERTEQVQAPDRLGEELVSRHLAQSVAAQHGAGLDGSELGQRPGEPVVFTGGGERARASIDSMEAEGLSAIQIRTISRQHEADLETIGQGLEQGRKPLEAAQVGFMAGGHRREVNAWERQQIDQDELSANPHLPSASQDLLEEAAEMESLRQGFTASGFIAGMPGQIEFAEMDGRFTEVGEPTGPSGASAGQLAAEASQGLSQDGQERSVGQAAVQGFSMGAASRLQASQGEPKPLGPKAQARLERHPEIAEAMGGPTGPVAEMERRTAGIQAPEVDDEGLGRH